MRIALMSGGYVNAGDFLIEKRSKELLEKFVADAEVHIFKRNICYNSKVDELNRYDLIVFGGGPGYQVHIYPNHMPFISDLEKLTVPAAIMGWGWWGKTVLAEELYHVKFSTQTQAFLQYIERSNVPLGCRDWDSLHFLKNQGFENMMMTGCPAWYDLEHIDTLVQEEVPRLQQTKADYPKICISDPGRGSPITVPFMKVMATYLRENYPKASIQLVFHRLLDGKEELVEESFLKEYDLGYVDITGKADGFSVYDDCSLHIGFRVHAHIYNLSRGNISILVNEDARGAGVNGALGIQNITLRPYNDIAKTGILSNELDDFIKSIDDYLQYIADSNFLQYRNAYSNIQFYYKRMQQFLKLLERQALSR